MSLTRASALLQFNGCRKGGKANGGHVWMGAILFCTEQVDKITAYCIMPRALALEAPGAKPYVGQDNGKGFGRAPWQNPVYVFFYLQVHNSSSSIVNTYYVCVIQMLHTHTHTRLTEVDTGSQSYGTPTIYISLDST